MEGPPADRRSTSIGPRGPDRSGIAVNEARIDKNHGAVLLPRQSGPCVREGQ